MEVNTMSVLCFQNLLGVDGSAELPEQRLVQLLHPRELEAGDGPLPLPPQPLGLFVGLVHLYVREA